MSPHVEEIDSTTASDPIAASADPLEVSCSIETSVCAKLSFATHQSAVPVLRDLRVTNNSSQTLQNLELEISSDPAVFVPRIWKLDRIQSGNYTDIRNRDLVLNAEFLLSIEEAVSARIVLKLWPDNGRGEDASCIAIRSYPVEILAASEWGGAASMAELLAMFVQPNNAAVARILKASAEVLRKADKPDRLDGYEAKTRARSYELASAIWSAISRLRLTYALPPASFETQGQKVRAPQQIVEQGLATCLDTALLFAAALEQIGLNPIIILTKGHAFTGVWLQPQEFASLITEDASAVRKRVALQELLVFETTLCMQSSGPGFGKAIAEGNRQIAEERETDFVMALDLRRARMQRLRPLALPNLSHTGSTAGSTSLSSEEPAEISLESAPALPAFDITESEIAATPEGRLQRWQRKLLDLTARNRLLHAPVGTSGVPILCPNPGQLEDELADGKSFRIVAAPQMESVMGRDAELYKSRTGEVLDSAYASDALARGEVLSLLQEPKLDAQLVELFRKSRLDLAEGGSNTLFLAVGFLNWKKNAADTRVYRAPLLLLPVKLDRRSVRSGVRLSLLDDEPRMNLTLLEMLRQEFRLEVPELAAGLPTDGHGVDVARIWTAVRKAVRDTPGFEVAEDVLLGSFSFAKYLMWKDLVDRTETLKANRVVRHLLETPREPYPYSAYPPRPEQLDQEIAPGELFTPLPADSSQLAAVVGSARGCDFVLDGPPGTGKSQTIANMIAHNLALGRRVLFVAEKRAALDVVYRRLRANGLGPFCLELHSNKANKKEVLDQLDRAWTTAEELPSEAWARDAEAICRERDALNALVKALHYVHPNGWTVHRAIGRVLLDVASPVQLHWPQQVTHDDTSMRALKDVARRLGLQRTAVAALDTAAFQPVGETEWSNAWQANLLKASLSLAATVAACTSARTTLLQKLGIELPASAMGLSALSELADFLPDAAWMNLGFVFSPNASAALEGVQKATALIAGYTESSRGLSSQYSPDALKALPLEHLASEWKKAKTAAWPMSAFKRKAVLHELSTLGVPNLDLDNDLDRLRQMRENQEAVARLGEQARTVPGWNGVGTDTQAMEKTIAAAAKLRLLVARSADSPAQIGALRLTLQSLLSERTEELLAGSPLHQAAAEYSRTYGLFSGALTEFERLAEPSDSASSQDLLDTTGRQAALLIQNISGLNRWTAWLRVRKEALSLGLEPLVDALEQGAISPAGTLPTFESAYARWWVEQALDDAPVLRTFNLAEHTDRLARFRSLDDEFASLTKRYIRAKLCGVIPSKIDPKLPPGFATLHHQLQLSKRHKPVRQLVTEMGTALTTLAPCLLMSPLSVAQYLPANAPLFDVVIFDEASQIAPWDAVGAIARGRQLIVAGDPKQMPPTSFFNKAAGADDDSDLADDQESLLDECLGAALPRHRLTWHYRSLHESLIAFSNHRYYEGDLLTFPAPVTRDTAVTLKRVAGCWSRGKSRTNQIEAEAIVKEVIRRLTDASLADAEGHFPSIAVITLNAEQQKLIEDLLDKARAQNPAIEPFFAEDAAEPVVVKNLETVQGDERDIVLLGIGYGPETPDAPSMPMNFGPLNRAGGWRRLNVAITRARREMLVYTSFPPHLIDLNRTASEALRDLKHFLEFAEQGPRALGQAVAGSLGGYESPFEEAVAEGLRNLGWSIVPQVGVSRYRVDLGIVHPDRPGDYLVGVECDGAMYHSAATARDRDKVRESVLRQLGWKLLRVWSTDWWIDRKAALQQLHARLEVLLIERRNTDQETERKRLEPEALAESAEQFVNLDLLDLSSPVDVSERVYPELSEESKELVLEEFKNSYPDMKPVERPAENLGSSGEQVVLMVEQEPAQQFSPLDGQDSFSSPASSVLVEQLPIATTSSLHTAHEPKSAPTTFQQGVYRATAFDDEKSFLQPDQFFEASYSIQLAEFIAKIVHQENPVKDDVLVERIARAHGFLRSGNRIRERVLSLTQSACYLLTEEGGATFVWLDVETASSWNLARYPQTNDDCRSIEDIALVELAAAFPKIDPAAHVTQVARNFGVKRLSVQARSRLERAYAIYSESV